MTDESGHGARAPTHEKRPRAVFRATIFVLPTAVLLFAGLRSQRFPQLFAGQDKFEHVLGFFCFGLGLIFHCQDIRRGPFFSVCTGLAVFIEVAQTWIPPRTPSVMDALAGMVGAGLAWICRRRGG